MSGQTLSPARTVDGVEVPAPGRYTLDAAHTYVGFSVRHMAVARVRGRFENVEGTIHIDTEPTRSWVEATIDAASIDTRNPDRDAHLRSADFLDVERFPRIRFRSRQVRHVGGDRWEVDGDLTIRDVTRPVTLEVTYNGALADPWGNIRFGFEASTTINREDFGLTWNQVLETGGLLIGKEVRIEIEGEAVRTGD